MVRIGEGDNHYYDDYNRDNPPAGSKNPVAVVVIFKMNTKSICKKPAQNIKKKKKMLLQNTIE